MSFMIAFVIRLNQTYSFKNQTFQLWQYKLYIFKILKKQNKNQWTALILTLVVKLVIGLLLILASDILSIEVINY